MTNRTLNQQPPAALLQNGPLIIAILLVVDSLHYVFARLLLPHLPATTLDRQSVNAFSNVGTL